MCHSNFADPHAAIMILCGPCCSLQLGLGSVSNEHNTGKHWMNKAKLKKHIYVDQDKNDNQTINNYVNCIVSWNKNWGPDLRNDLEDDEAWDGSNMLQMFVFSCLNSKVGTQCYEDAKLAQGPVQDFTWVVFGLGVGSFFCFVLMLTVS